MIKYSLSLKVHKKFCELQPNVNFTNILLAAFSRECFCTAFMCFVLFGFVFFWRKDFGAKAAHKMLVKLTP
jgi:hypothetical protein